MQPSLHSYILLTVLMMMMRAAVIRSLSTSPPARSGRSVVLASSVSKLLRNPSLLSSSTPLKDNTSDDDKDTDTFAVYNPAHAQQQVIAHVPVMGRVHAEAAIARAATALPSWRDDTTAPYRAAILQAWSRAITDHAHDLAIIMTLESGKPLREALSEVAYATSFLDYYAAEAMRPTSAGGGFLVPSPFTCSSSTSGAPRGQVMAIQQAVGVCAMITPWNFPAAMITRKVGPALAVGCTAVVKPSELTPLTALALQQLAVEVAGLPNGCLEVVTSNRHSAADVGQAFCQADHVRKLSFTGSTAVGKVLMQQCSGTVKRLSLELGGNAPFVVFDDADLDQAVHAAVASKFRNAGQTCVCADRFLIHERIHDEFVDKFCRAVEETLKIGPGLEPSVNFGPLINRAAVDSVDAKVQEAIKEGAICRTGGKSVSAVSANYHDDGDDDEKLRGGNFYAPTILTNVSLTSRIWATETFGPVAAIRSFASEEEALAIANDSPVGLAGYFCTQDMSRAFRFGKQLECGLVGVNEGVISTCVAPFGGVKESGMGREGSPIGISEYLETKYLFINA